jgi:hypothetical protein
MPNKFTRQQHFQVAQTRKVEQDSKRDYTFLNKELSFEVSIQARMI